MKLLFTCWIFPDRFSFLRKSCKDQKVRFFAYTSIADCINRFNVKMTTSPWRSALNLDCSHWDFFQKIYFFRKEGISIRDWNIFFAIFACSDVAYKIHFFCAFFRFGAKPRKSSLDKLSPFNIINVVWPWLSYGPSLFKYKQGRYAKKITKILVCVNSGIRLRIETS